MELAAISMYFAMGLGLGMLHAFDPDHLAAVAGVNACDRNSRPNITTFAAKWAAGHGSSLILIAVLVIIFGMNLPEGLSAIAEGSVAYLLIALGAFALWRIFSESTEVKSLNPHRSAPLVGLVHGIAGSAPLLALLPLSKIAHPALALLYVLFFSAGVAIAMTSIGLVFSVSMKLMQRYLEDLRVILQIFFALVATIVGCTLLL